MVQKTNGQILAIEIEAIERAMDRALSYMEWEALQKELQKKQKELKSLRSNELR